MLAALGDDHLVEQIRRGNEVAFEVAYDRHHRGILAFCRHMLGSREEAEDAVQHTFTSAYTDLQSNDRDIRLKAWLYTIARNRCLSMLRARREQPAELDEQPTAGLSEEVQRREDLRDLLDDLGDLPDDQREALVLFEVGDLSQAEVARVIGVEPVKVKALVFQARSSLIEKREARAIPCTEIREQLATASGGALRRGPLRRHLKVCEGCREYRDQVREQRTALALILPVVPTVGLRESILSAIGFGGGAGGAGIATGGAAGGALMGGSGAGGTGFFASIAGAGGLKIALAATIAGGGLVGGGIGLERAVDDAGPSKAQAADEADKDTPASGGGQEPGSSGTVPIAGGNEGGDADGDNGDKDDKGDRKGDDERDNRSDAADRAERRRNAGRGGKGRGRRGNSAPGSRRGGKSGNRGRRLGSNRGRRPVNPPRGPKRPTGTTAPDSDTTGDSTVTAPDGSKDTRQPRPPMPSTDTPIDDGVAEADDATPKDDAKERLLDAVPVAE